MELRSPRFALALVLALAGCPRGPSTEGDGGEDTRTPDAPDAPDASNDLDAPARDGTAGSDVVVPADVFIPTDSGVMPVASPTGRNPRLLWTPARQGVWARMRAENHWAWQYVLDGADRSGTPRARYGDFGHWAAVVYQVTGDTAYVARAWAQLMPMLGSPPPDGNFSREHFEDLVWIYDWLYPGLTPAQRQSCIDTINLWATDVLPVYRPDQSGPTATNGSRTNDSDEATGHYFGLAFAALATGPDNPRAASLLAAANVGGLDASAADFTSLRNAVRRFAESAAGGEWVESTEYNLGTLRLLLMGAEGVRTATGAEHFPEVSALAPALARAMLHEVTPDLDHTYEWGDMDDPRQIHTVRRATVHPWIIHEAARTDPGIAAQLTAQTDALRVRHESDPAGSIPNPYFFLAIDPYSPSVDYRAAHPTGHFANGRGLLLMRDGWSPGSTLVGVHNPTFTRVDHEVGFAADFQVYRRGAWAVTRPLGYGNPAELGEYSNGMLFAGLSSMDEFRGPIAQEIDAGGEYGYLAGGTFGRAYPIAFYDPPAVFLHEWTRSTVYLPSHDGRTDTLVVYDRTDADPVTAADRARYRASDAARIAAAPALKQWFIHALVRPTVAADGLAWEVPAAGGGTQSVRVATLLPARQVRTVVDEDALWPEDFPYPAQSEQHFHVRITPETTQRWDTFLNVVQVTDPGTALHNTLVADATHRAEGALLTRAGEDDALVLFGATPGARLVTAGYSVAFTAASPQTRAYLFDLDPTRAWTVAVDRGAPAALSVSPAGVARVTVPGAGARALAVAPR